MELKSIWWENFVNTMKEFGNKEFIQVTKDIEALDGRETEEGIKRIKEEVSELRNILRNLNDHEKQKLQKLLRSNLGEEDIGTVIEKYYRKIRILENRINRKINDNFGLMVLHLRNKLGLSLKALSEMTGISTSYINRIEKGERKTPSIKIIESLANALCVDKSVLLEVANLDTEAKESINNVDIDELFFKNNFTINGKAISRREKELFSKIMTKIAMTEWTSRTKHIESLEIIDLIDQFKTI